MRVLHVVPTYLPATRYGGPIYSVHGLCKGLVELGHEVHVFTTNVDGFDDSDVPLGQPVELDGVKVWYFPSNRLRRLYYSAEMSHALKKQMPDFDIVHLHSVFLWPTWAAARSAHKFGKPYVLSPRGMLVKDLITRKSRWLKTLWIQLIEKNNIRKAALIHLTSTVEKSEMSKFEFNVSKDCVVPNGVNSPDLIVSEEITADIRELTSEPFVLYLGRINWKKGLDRLISAMSEIEDHRLLIVGNDEEGYIPTLDALVRKLGLGSRVAFIPRFVSGSDKEHLFDRATLFILPSYSENFGNTVPEAMARGCAVIATEEVGASELIRSAKAGIVCVADQLPQAIAQLLNDENQRALCASSGSKWIQENLSWKSVAKSIEAQYAEVSSVLLAREA